ncbi:transmembrane glycoprotein NMB [Lepus europaeus]|uniref:transmembrane glycoprotein NMB n=1 Tax=Lepus europaeus TaxID=9983 RepID=UPI002B495666|nr:transmembrane glycoprotein NMB [Lepus europaeus]
MEPFYYFLGFLLLAARPPRSAATRFRDVLDNENPRGSTREHPQLDGWSPDENNWNEKLYPVWKRGDVRWGSSWKGGCVQAVLTSDSPALVGSTLTFVVDLVFSRCQKEDASSINDTGPPADPYMYNWTAWAEDGDWGNDSGQSHHNVFPDGKPFPHPWKKWNFVYVFHTLGHYFYKLGRCSARVSLDTTNVTLGPQLMEVTVYRRHGRAFMPIAQVKDVYVVTDQIPVFVTMTQKSDRNSSDETFLRNVPIVFDVLLHDPSHFLNKSAIRYKWSFGDNTGLFVSDSHTLNHTYVHNGTFSLNLTVQAVVPGPCPPPTPRPPKPSPPPGPAGDSSWELREVPEDGCQINRYGYFEATLTIVEGILAVNIIQIAEVPMAQPQPGDSLMDLVVTCQGPVPREVCTVISDPTCQVAWNSHCNPVDENESCLLTVRRAFRGPGTYCVNLTLGDDASLALASTLISVPGRAPATALGAGDAVLIAAGCLALGVTMLALYVYRKHKEYKRIENSAGITASGAGLNVGLGHARAAFLPGRQEKHPLLKDQPGRL